MTSPSSPSRIPAPASADKPPSSRRLCGLIAGAGAFPFHVAREAKRQGLSIIAAGIQGRVDSSLAQQVDGYEELSVGQLGRLIAFFKASGVQHVIMAGKVTKDVLFDPTVQFDQEALAVLNHVTEFSVNAVLGAIARRLAQEGIELLDSSTFLKTSLCPEGVVTQQSPSPADEDDIRFGLQVARQLAQLDVGQTVVVKRRVIVAVEALEGTDETIRRAGALAGPGGIVVKMASPMQDMRFDLPVLGLETINIATSAGIRCLAVEAQKTILLEKELLIARANAAGLIIVGLRPVMPEAS